MERASARRRPRAICDRFYRISVEGADRARVVRVERAPGAARDAVGRLCHEVFERRESPCQGCPAFDADLGSTPRSGAIGEDEDGALRIVTASRDGDGVEVRAVCLSPAELVAAVLARLEAIGRHAGLSNQERKVFDRVSRGQRGAEIAAALGIRERTVKYHLANVLGKLGIDSRTEIVKLLLDPTR